MTEQAFVIGGCEDRTVVRVTGKVAHWPNIESREVDVGPEGLIDAATMSKAMGLMALDKYRLERIAFPDTDGDLAMYVYAGTYIEGKGNDGEGVLTVEEATKRVFAAYVDQEEVKQLREENERLRAGIDRAVGRLHTQAKYVTEDRQADGHREDALQFLKEATDATG
jgi:hypothetical protein